jgi:pyruvate dehydrogenase E2 component (dihydrolipoamide acetyltransferase)
MARVYSSRTLCSAAVGSSASDTTRTETARGSVEVREPTKLEQATARRVAESKATIPHMHVDAEVAVGAAVAAAGAAGSATLGDAVVRAAALALREFPRLNAAYRDGRFELYSRINVGITVVTDSGTAVPTLFDADTKSLAEIAEEARRLEAAARDAALTAPQLAGGTFTFADLSQFAIDSHQPVVHGGQAAFLALGGVREAPLVRDGGVVAGPVARATLACDNRIVDGASAAAFLARTRTLLEGGDG